MRIIVIGLAAVLITSSSALSRSRPAREDRHNAADRPSMWGYAARKDAPVHGVRDRSGTGRRAQRRQRSIGVGLDLGPPTRQHGEYSQAIEGFVGIEHVFLVASHRIMALYSRSTIGREKEKPYVHSEDKLVRVITEANKNLVAAKLGVSSHEVAFNRNRHWKKPNPPLDKEMLIARIDDADGKPIAHLVNFAAHPTMLPAKLREFSHDFPGFLAQHVEKELGGLCLFLQGAAGDLSANPQGEGGPEKFGAALGKFVVEKSKAIKCELAEPKYLKARERDFKFTSRIDLSNPLVYAAYSVAFFPKLIDFYEREYREGVRPHVTTALLDGKIGFVGISGELFASHAIHLKRRAQLQHLFVLGYCNDYQQYFRRSKRCRGL